MNTKKAKHLLDQLLIAIDEFETPAFGEYLRTELEKDGLESLLKSNSIWGGSGSVADQAGMRSEEGRKKITDAIICLGEFQLASGHVNPRTRMWTDAYKSWSAEN